MACLINRDEAGNLTSVLSPHNKKESQLFEKLKEKISPSSALLMWGATDTPTFNSLYGGSKDENGEPVFMENDKQIWFMDKNNEPFFIQDKGSAVHLDITREEIRAAVTETLSDTSDSYNWQNQPLSDITAKMLESKDFDEMKPFLEKIFLKTKAALEVTKTIQTEKKKVVYKGGEKERFFLGNQQLSGVSFNDDGLAQGFMQGYSYKEWDPTLDYADNNKKKLWDANGFPDSKRLEFNGEFLNAEEYLAKTKRNLALGSIKGKVIHLYDQWNYASLSDKKAIELSISQLINTYNATQPDDKQIKDTYMSWVKDVKAEVDMRLGLSPDDKVIHELQIVSPELGIIGSIDKYIIRSDGSITIRDIKTSESLLVNNDYISFFKHSNIEATPLNKAKFQVFLYALAVGLKNDNVRFSHLGVDMLSSVNRAGQMNADQSLSRQDIEDFIKMFNKYIKAESGDKASPHSDIMERIKNHPTALKNWLNPNNTSNYISALDVQPVVDESGNIYYSDVRTESHSESAIKEITMAMGIMQTASQFRETALQDNTSKIAKQYKNMDANILKFVSIWSEGGMDPNMWNRDISFMNMWVGGTVANVRHPLVRVYNQYLENQKRIRDTEHNQNMDRAKAYFLPVLNKWRKAAGMSTMKSPNEAWSFFLALRKGDFLSSKFSKNWDSMYKTITVEGVTEKIPKSGDELRAEGLKEEAALQDYFQSIYNKELDSSNKDAYIYKEATYTNKNGRFTKINHIDVMNGQQIGQGPYRNWSYKAMTEKVDENGKIVKVPFVARVPRLDHEYFADLEATGNKVSKFKELFVKYLTNFWDSKLQEQPIDAMTIPIRFLGNPNDNLSKYSKDMMWQFENFSMNITNKKHMDSALAVGSAMALHLENVNSEKDEAEKVKHLTKFIKMQAQYQATGQLASDDSIRNVRKTTQNLFRVPIKIQSSTGKYDEYVFSLYSLINGLRNYVAHSVMGLNALGAAYNAFQAIFSSLKTATNFKIGAYVLHGADDEAFDFKPGDVAKGFYEWVRMQESAINGDANKMKLYLIGREINYVSDNNDIGKAKNALMTNPNRSLSASKMFLLHSSAEEMNKYALLYAQLQNKVKVKTVQPDGTIKEEKKSLWDLYDVELSEDINGEKIYKASFNKDSSRGKYYEGGVWKEAKGLTNDEGIKIRRVYERIQGNYNTDEKSILEMYALGAFFMQFKRFFPSILRSQFQSRRKDSSLGRYVQAKSDTGEDIIRWEAREITGKYRLLVELIFGNLLHKMPLMKNQNMIALGDKVEWRDLSKDEQVQLLDFATTIGSWLLLLAAGFKAQGDDEDKENAFSKMLFKLSDTVIQPISINQTASGLKNLSPVGLNMLYNSMVGATQLLGRAAQVGLGIEESLFNEAGNLPGLKALQKNVPYLGSFYKIKDTIEDLPDSGAQR